MGWTSARDTAQQLREMLYFPTEKQAVDFAEREGFSWTVLPYHSKKLKAKAFADNFKWSAPGRRGRGRRKERVQRMDGHVDIERLPDSMSYFCVPQARSAEGQPVGRHAEGHPILSLLFASAAVAACSHLHALHQSPVALPHRVAPTLCRVYHTSLNRLQIPNARLVRARDQTARRPT